MLIFTGSICYPKKGVNTNGQNHWHFKVSYLCRDKLSDFWGLWTPDGQGRNQAGGVQPTSPPNPPKPKFKRTQIFVDITISKALRGLLFNRNQPLNSAYD
jgi:hypothetical protein